MSGVMGELLDSYYVSQYSFAEYEARAIEYVDVLDEHVDIWEIGNEINGEWVCAQDAESCSPDQTAAVVSKMRAGALASTSWLATCSMRVISSSVSAE